MDEKKSIQKKSNELKIIKSFYFLLLIYFYIQIAEEKKKKKLISYNFKNNT